MSQTFTQILYRLLSYPEYVEPLRREIHAAVAEEGWTTAGMDRIHKLDSFVRETQRIDTMGLGSSASLHSGAVTDTFFEVAMARLALRPFTFSNGVIIPAGTLIAVPSSAIHMDEEIYSNPERFDGFRFSKLSGCNKNGDVTMTGHSAVSISPKHLAFGLGRHAW